MSDSLNLFGKQRASLIADTITYPDIVLCSYISFQTVQRIKLFFFLSVSYILSKSYCYFVCPNLHINLHIFLHIKYLIIFYM